MGEGGSLCRFRPRPHLPRHYQEYLTGIWLEPWGIFNGNGRLGKTRTIPLFKAFRNYLSPSSRLLPATKTLCRLWHFLAPRLPFREIFANHGKSKEDRVRYYTRLLEAKLSKTHVLRILRFLDPDTLYVPQSLAAFALDHRFITQDEAPEAEKILSRWGKKQAFPIGGDGLLEGTQTQAWRGTRWKASAG